MPESLRWVTRIVFSFAVTCFLPPGAPAAETKTQTPRPNIVLIMADDLGYGHLGCYGQTKIETPHIDRLAAEGLRFTQAYAGSNVCAPARSTLMTGLHTGHTPVRANGKNRYLYDDDVTLAEVLRDAGYTTGIFGKWGLGNIDTPGPPTRQGFDEFFGHLAQVHAHFFYPYWVWKNEERFLLPENESGARGRYVHDVIHAEAMEFIRQHHDRPFFAYLPYIPPHVELVVPEDSEAPYRDRFPRVTIEDPRDGYIGSDHAYATYAGMISRLDRHVGEIVALLDELDIADNTLVIFTSDNGPQGAAWSKLIEFFDGNGPLQGSKGNFYEGGIRVPLIARWPGHVERGSVTAQPCAFWDLLPTLAALASGQTPESCDGVSLVPTLVGSGKQQQHEFFYWEYPLSRGLAQAVRWGDWKGLREREDAPIELYDLSRDPVEAANVAAQHPEIVARIDEIMAEEHTPERDYPELDPRPSIKDFVR